MGVECDVDGDCPLSTCGSATCNLAVYCPGGTCDLTGLPAAPFLSCGVLLR